MKKLFENWKNYVVKEENDIDIPQEGPLIGNIEASEDAAVSNVDIAREYIKEIQDMAIRLIAIQDELKEKYNAGGDGYFPGHEFRKAARSLAEADPKFGISGSLASNLSRYIENETSLPILQRQVADKLKNN